MPKRPDLTGFGLRILGSSRNDGDHPVDSFTTDADAGKIINVPVGAIEPNPDQPRKYFDPEALADLTESVRQRGVLQPIIVRHKGDDGFVLIAGERRWRAATKAGLAKIPALVRHENDSAEIALIENLQRENLNPIEEAESLQRLKQQRDLTDEQLARIVGKSRPSIVASLSLNRLPQPIILECQTSDRFTKSQLLEVLRQPTAEAQLALWQLMKSGGLTVRQARAKVEETRGTKPISKSFEHSYRPDDRTFTVRVKFRKSRATTDDIRQALRAALDHLT
ncbi:MAG: ParB/RepB/Spo0J family partition protein [Deltaproteobacteria bacterium]|nr:ParB/RepB/Spo0J family partition protein [Deltaproteobacteria bacterium]